MENYKKVEVTNYVKQGIENGTMVPRQAEKFARIIARQGTIGETVISWSVDSQGNEIQEKVAQVQIDDSTFKKKYEIDPENTSLCRPKGGPQIFVQIPDNIILNQWGSDMQIAAGGYINITNVDDMYGISQRDFEDTYKFTDNLSKKGPKK